MKKEYKFIIILFIIGEILYISPFILLEIINIKYINKKDMFWYDIKIDTLKRIISKNKMNYPILNFTNGFNEIYLYRNYEDLLKNSTKDKCRNGLRKCGILDTYGNIMCLENYLSCPINEIIIDNKTKKNEYSNKGFYSLELNEEFNVYYTNNSISKEIVFEFKISEEYPKLITKENLNINDYIYKQYFGEDINSNNFFNEPETKKYQDYILRQINIKDNIDISYKNIFENKYYIKNNIGFENDKQMNIFTSYNFNFYNIYKNNRILEIINIIYFTFSIIIFFINIFPKKKYKLIRVVVTSIYDFYIRIFLLAYLYSYIDDLVEILLKNRQFLDSIIKDFYFLIHFRIAIIFWFHFFTFSTFLLIPTILATNTY